MRGPFLVAPLALAMSLPACPVRAAAELTTAPVQPADGTTDAAASQTDNAEKRGKEMRKRQEEYAKLDRRYTQQLKRCRKGDRVACSVASETWAEMQLLLPPDGAAVSSR